MAQEANHLKDQRFLCSDTHELIELQNIPPGQMCLVCVFVKCEVTHPVVSVCALPFGSRHVLSFAFCLCIKKTSSELIADR